MITPERACFIITLVLVHLAQLGISRAAATGAVDPHWTGTHCAECHLTGHAPALRFDGDVVRVCNRCHGADPAPCMKVHTQGTVLPDTMHERMPADWPLAGLRVTCLTCHEVQLQMYSNPAEKAGNNNFVRSGEPDDPSGFCLACHQEERFHKTNPHQYGVITESRSPCFRCHTEGLASGLAGCFEASLKTVNPSLCMGCHWDLPEAHTAHVLLERERIRQRAPVLQELERDGLELPLADGRMHCATCHNPHPPGVIGRREAAVGAGEQHFLRVTGTRDLCLICHEEKSLEGYWGRFRGE